MSANSSEQFAYVENIGNIEENYEYKSIAKANNKAKALLYIEKALKRFIDIIGSIVGIILLIPLSIGIKIANIKAKDYGPLFYKQKRIGKNGKEFTLYKYRSMIIDADEKLDRYLEENEEAREEYSTYKKLKDDPRITKVGHFIRNTSLDEFPQFINVLKGDMSLVGPRPYLPKEKTDMGRLYHTITKSKPGVTGMWQVSGRSEITFEDRMNMDIEYYYNWSLKTDLKLLFKTVKQVILRKGAI